MEPLKCKKPQQPLVVRLFLKIIIGHSIKGVNNEATMMVFYTKSMIGPYLLEIWHKIVCNQVLNSRDGFHRQEFFIFNGKFHLSFDMSLVFQVNTVVLKTDSLFQIYFSFFACIFCFSSPQLQHHVN